MEKQKKSHWQTGIKKVLLKSVKLSVLVMEFKWQYKYNKCPILGRLKVGSVIFMQKIQLKSA